jgi:cysteine desulfurase
MHYFDHHATTPCDPAVVAAMEPFWREEFGNAASRAHGLGLRAREATEDARGQVAAFVGASPKEVVFTSGATEANNLAILGLVRSRGGRGHVVTVATEHHAVLDPVAAVARQGGRATVLPVDGEGLVDVDAVAGALEADTVLLSMMAVNNEIGVEAPLEASQALCRARGVAFHIDAAQAAYRPLDGLGDLISLSAHKLYGPKGVGALIVRRQRPPIVLEPLVYGGGHERGLRSGTLPVPLVVGFGEACRLALANREAEATRLRALRDRLWIALRAAGGAHLNGPSSARAPHNLNLSFDGVEAEALLMGLRDRVALSTGSACSSATLERSHVLRALGLSPARIAGSVRIGLGRSTTEEAVDEVAAAMIAKVQELRRWSSVYDS